MFTKQILIFQTYCMMGTEDNPGIVSLTVAEIFKKIEMTPNREFLLRVGFIEIYNERIFDLLSTTKVELLKLHENDQGEVTTNLTERITQSAECILKTYADGNANRKTGETGMNDQSSRSHSIFRIMIESKEHDCSEGIVQFSTLNLVDLAGSERADQTKATGERLREGGHINKSLLALSKVIRELSDIGENREKIQFINYRDSKLTRLLSASLGGNAQTAIICTVTPASLEETLSTLKYDLFRVYF
jgi:centromeric protein E